MVRVRPRLRVRFRFRVRFRIKVRAMLQLGLLLELVVSFMDRSRIRFSTTAKMRVNMRL